MLPLPAAGAEATGDTTMSSTQHQLIEQCATRLRGIVEALDNIHDTSPHRWSTDLDDVHSSAESLLALIKDQAPARSETSFEEWLANELEGEDGQPVPAAVCDIALARRAFNHWPKLEQPAKVGGVRFSAGVSSRLVVEAAQRLYEFESTPEQEAERIERLQAFREQLDPLNLAPHAKAFNEAPAEALKSEQAEAERPEVADFNPCRYHAEKIRQRADEAASAYEAGRSALGYMEDIAESALIVRNGLDELSAQHERIVGELRAKLQAAEDRADTLEHRMMGMMTRHFAEAWRNRDTQKALDGYLSAGIAQLEQERDAALAEVERLRQFERICEGLPQDAIDGGWTVQGIRCYAKRLEDQLKSALARVAELTANRNRYGVDAHYFNKNLQRILRDFESFTPDELARSLIILAKVADEKVVAQHSVPEGFIGRLSEFLAQRGATGKALLRELRDMLAAAPARGQHSVPEEFSFEYRHPNGECHTVTVSREQVINEMPDFLFEALCSKFCNCEPVGETNVVECRCDEYAEEFKLLAAAPGKEGL
ncbi:hypothetical protein [Pseudomonas aeruginosa]|uniref:hypothetical protein n=1 Tax=Pseudomonas aeruginosa TaxID=287 RepID=UPI000B205FDA|nr:hypothetical protein [Pseudomonas aeruginosa]